jgi:hypothetical protein
LLVDSRQKEKAGARPAGVALSNDRGSLLAPEKEFHVAMTLQYGSRAINLEVSSVPTLSPRGVGRSATAVAHLRKDMPDEGHDLMTAYGLVSFP